VSSVNTLTAVLASVFGIAALLFTFAAIPPALVPWHQVSASLRTYHSDLEVVAVGVAGVAVVLFFLLLAGF
jgi:hypothetical protein